MLLHRQVIEQRLSPKKAMHLERDSVDVSVTKELIFWNVMEDPEAHQASTTKS